MHRRLGYPWVFVTNGRAVGWLIQTDLGRLVGTDDDTVWKWNPPSREFRRRIKRLEAKVDARQAAFRPAPRVKMFWWPSRNDWLAEENRREIWADLHTMGDYDQFKVDIILDGKVFHAHPVTAAHT